MYRFIYNTLKKLTESLGYNLTIRKRPKNIRSYEVITPLATYAPWLQNNLFNKIYGLIKNYTLVDKYRCFELWQLVAETAKLNGALIEIGVWRGGSGALIAKKAKLEGINDKIYLCDTFKGVVKAGIYDISYKGREHADTSKETVNELIQKLNLDNVKLLVGIFPDETSKIIMNEKFRFCHIDVDVYQSAKDIFDWLWARLVIGGVMVFDDYGFKGCVGVTKFVNEEKKKKDRLVIYNLNGHAIVIKVSD